MKKTKEEKEENEYEEERRRSTTSRWGNFAYQISKHYKTIINMRAGLAQGEIKGQDRIESRRPLQEQTPTLPHIKRHDQDGN